MPLPSTSCDNESYAPLHYGFIYQTVCELPRVRVQTVLFEVVLQTREAPPPHSQSFCNALLPAHHDMSTTSNLNRTVCQYFKSQVAEQKSAPNSLSICSKDHLHCGKQRRSWASNLRSFSSLFLNWNHMCF